MQITTDDRDPVTGRIMVEAQQRAAARETPPVAPAPAEPAPRPRRLSNRRGHADPTAPAKSYKGAVGAIVGLLGFAILIALGTRLLPGTAPLADRGAAPTAAMNNEQRPTTDEPIAAPATVDAYAAPDGALLGPIPASAPIKYRYGSTSWGGVEWRGKIVWIKADHTPPASYPDLAPPTPAPTPRIIYVEPECDVETNPAYTAQIDVSAGGKPIGIARGVSCDSQADAQANAESIAREMKEAKKP